MNERTSYFFIQSTSILHRQSTPEIKKLAKAFEELNIAHPLIEYNEEALKLVLELRYKLKDVQICKRPESIGDLIFENIQQRRIILTRKMLIMEGYNEIYTKCINEDGETFTINDVKFSMKQFFWSLKFSCKLNNDVLSYENLLKTKEYLDENFDYETYQVKTKSYRENANLEIHKNEYEIDGSQNENNSMSRLQSQSIISINLNKKESSYRTIDSTSAEVMKLKNEKNMLENKKLRTERVLEMLRKFVRLKENVLRNKKRYQFILFVMSKVKSGQIMNISSEGNVDDLIEGLDYIEHVNDDELELNESDKRELDNFENAEELLKHMEKSIFDQVKDILAEEDGNHNDEEENLDDLDRSLSK